MKGFGKGLEASKFLSWRLLIQKEGKEKKNHFTQGDSLFLPTAGTHLGANPSRTKGDVGPLGLGDFGERRGHKDPALTAPGDAVSGLDVQSASRHGHEKKKQHTETTFDILRS